MPKKSKKPEVEEFQGSALLRILGFVDDEPHLLCTCENCETKWLPLGEAGLSGDHVVVETPAWEPSPPSFLEDLRFAGSLAGAELVRAVEFHGREGEDGDPEAYSCFAAVEGSGPPTKSERVRMFRAITTNLDHYAGHHVRQGEIARFVRKVLEEVEGVQTYDHEEFNTWLDALADMPGMWMHPGDKLGSLASSYFE